MKTLFLLMAQFDGRVEIPLTEICDLLDLSECQAKRQASMQRLPFPVHRLGSQKSPWLVHVADLAAYIDERREKAERHWHYMNRRSEIRSVSGRSGS